MHSNNNSNRTTIMLKLSGASLNHNDSDNIISFEILNEIAQQIKVLINHFNVAIVLGGGNIWRGSIASKVNMPRDQADYMGMLATIINSIAFESILKNINIDAKVFSKIEMEKICDTYYLRNVKDYLNKGGVAILAAGTGMPYFSTDTGSAITAIEIGAKFILMGKNNVDGVYSCDPLENPNAEFYKTLTYDDVISKNLRVMDTTAIALCKEYKTKIIVFNINEKNSIIDTLNRKSKFTIIE
ncbi:UMP kinase [Malacoplasma muris]|uniref:UMP kinase n=1 Tax=Malacoplasma muris TaxID=2119 RepID=UPI00398F8B79